MTSIILMQKLLTMKLDRTEFHRIKMQRANVNQKKHKILKSLTEILETQNSKKTCRLCLKFGGRKIFNGDQDFDVAYNIKNILGIVITEDDGKPQHVCGACARTLRRAARLRETADATRWRLQQEMDMVADSASDWSEGPEPHGGCFKALETTVAREWHCRECRASFHTQEEFAAHEKQPSCRVQPTGYVCETCGLELKTMSRLKRHRLTHSGALPHACASCAYRARTAHALAVHARTHSGARPARCALCPARFASASNLAAHRRAHRPPDHHCPVCRKGFKFKVALRNHMASQHSNARPYNCSICTKAFATRKMILRHELKAHNRPKMRSGVLPSYMRVQEDS